MAFNVALQIGKTAFQVGIEGMICIGAFANGYRCVSGLVNLDEEGQATAQKAQDIFLSGVRSLGMVCGALKWAEFCGWISLGAASMPISLIAYPCIMIDAIFKSVDHGQKIREFVDAKGLAYREWRIGIESVRLAAQVCLIAFCALGAVALIVGGGEVLTLVVLGTVLAYGILLGVAWRLNKLVEGWELQRQPRKV